MAILPYLIVDKGYLIISWVMTLSRRRINIFKKNTFTTKKTQA
jgi:hypothetical protein